MPIKKYQDLVSMDHSLEVSTSSADLIGLEWVPNVLEVSSRFVENSLYHAHVLNRAILTWIVSHEGSQPCATS